jgi:uncharacterized glyoxalase superfamily protein PhnB
MQNSLKSNQLTDEKISPQKLGVHIKCSDIYNSLKFYRSLGFNEVFAYGSGDFLEEISKDIATVSENYNGVSFEIGGAVLEIADGHLAVKPGVFEEKIKSSKLSLFFDIESLSELQEACEKNNIKISVPPKHYHWGSTELVVKDPDGVVLVFRELD